MTAHQDVEFTEYVSARRPALRRLALLLCQDLHRADDLVQAALIKLYLHWTKAAGADSINAYVNTILVREFLHERRASWTRRVNLTDQVPERPAAPADLDRSLDLQAAVAALPPRQRATLVLRYYCDLNIDQVADVMRCSPSTVKSQTFKALEALRGALGPDSPSPESGKLAAQTRRTPGKVPGHA
jgi:RNA polymerase sigma-70 factor (sigma-E family)